ncbi:MAG: response regulator [Proteobacteria bacterium]|nr:response regulator [Pseudomonadota bacterium]MBU1737913.1 response regulator [Pseudomonadota bacterium]
MKLNIRNKILAGFALLCLVIGITGVLSVRQVNTIDHSANKFMIEETPLVDAIMELKYWTSQGHLILEEILNGDQEEDIGNSWKNFDQALWYCDAILSGGQNEEGRYIASHSPLVRKKIEETRQYLEEFIRLAKKRYSFHSGGSAAGSDVDQAFDRLYESIQQDLDTLAVQHPDLGLALNYQKFRIADTHLFFEEFLGGDRSIDPEGIVKEFTASFAAITGTLKKRNIPATNLDGTLERFLAQVLERLKTHSSYAGAGTAIDDAFDLLYQKVVASSDQAETAIQQSMAEEQAHVAGTLAASRLIVLASSIIALLLALFTGLLLAHDLSAPIVMVTGILQKMAKGELDENIELSRRDEVGEMAESCQQVIESQRRAASFADQVGGGNYDTELHPNSAGDRLGHALVNMAERLAGMSRQNKRQIWLVESQAGLVEKIRGELDPAVIAEKVCTYLAGTIGAQIASFYLLTENQALRLTGDYAFHLRKGLADTIQIGQGLVGEAARSGKLISITDIPEDYIRVNSSLGDCRPANIVVLPFLHEGEVLGVIELGSCHEFSLDHLALLENCRETIAIAVHSARIHSRINELLQEGQQQNEELQTQQEELQAANEELRESQEALQAQQEELRVSNEELQEKSNSLERSEKSLQAQQEELRVTNEELEEKNKFMALKQDEIRQKNVELEDIRTHLELKARELEISSRYKSEFLANMSHELRTPLNSLLILSQDLLADKKKNLSEEQLESLTIIYKGGNDLLELINEILDLAKIESGRLDVNPAAVPFEDLAANLTDCFSHLAADKKLDFSIRIAPEMPPTMTTDFQKVVQILRNLCGNAIKFTRKGGVKVDIMMADPAGGLAGDFADRENVMLFRVADTGIGVAKDKQQEIFEAFQQADGSTSREFGGTGLGLSISRELAKLLGGEITLTSKVGKGSVFNLYLPLEFNPEKPQAANTARPEENELPEQDPDKPVARSRKAAPEVQSIDDDRQNISEKDRVMLVIEDDPDFAAILKRLCQQRGYRFLHAGGGVSGLVMAEQYRPDGIILDLILPDMSGWDVLNTLKKNKKTRHIPVHIISGDPSAQSGTSRGAMGVLLKPSSAEDIDAAFGRIEAVFARKVKKLLIVEDDDVLRKSLMKMTASDTVAVTAVAGGNEALAELRGGEYDCMILDLSLPDRNGFEVLQEISALDEKPPVIVYTGKELSQEEEYTLKRYANSIILKTARSSERLMDEAELFLHKMSDDLPEEKRKREASIRNYEKELQDKEILLADDDMRNMFALSKILKDSGVKVHQAPDGKKALEILGREKNISLVIMDIMMPVMDGYEAIGRIRKMKDYAKVPIIALTAKAMPADRNRCIEAGASDYLAKPVEIEKLLSLIRVWI